MPENRVIPADQPTSKPGYEILVDGEVLAPSVQVSGVSVIKKINRIASAEINCMDGDAAAEDFPLSSSDKLLPGAEVEIKAGYKRDFTTIFIGKITEHSIKARQGKPGRLIINCRDAAFAMTLGKKSSYFYDQSDSDIFEQLLSSYSLEAEVASTEVTHQGMVQYYASDWDFVVSRAEANAQVVLCDDGKVSTFKPDPSIPAEVSVLYGATVLEFEGKIDARLQMGVVPASAWDPANQENTETEAAEPTSVAQGNIPPSDLSSASGFDVSALHTDARADQTEIQSWADHQLQKARLAIIRGRVKVQGLPQLKPGMTLEVQGLGDRFNGIGYISGIHHQLSAGSFTTDVELGLSEKSFFEEFDISATPARGLLPAVQGLHPAVVTALADDPDGENRIKVSLPAVDPTGEGIWARIATLDAGGSRGSFFLPEIGDEVIVGFLDNDPRHPVVLGQMHSSARPAPAEHSDDNHEKGIVTRSGMRIWFNDDDVSLSIDTPNGNKILLSEADGAISIEDENGNTTSFSSDGIQMESASDVIIKASGDIKLEGTNVEVKANAEFKAEGSAGAKLESSGSTTVKGSIVQIN